ncbi:MAG: response regulator transcription factor [Betaproteobacteria bacterium]
MRKISVLVVDDEPLARERLSRLLAEGGCQVLAELGDGQALKDWLTQGNHADVIFLDIQMPGPSGIEVLADLPVRLPVVFVTAFSEYAVRAFELAAVDYLLKPVFEDRLALCLARLREQSIRPLLPSELRILLPHPTRFPVRAGDGEVFMDLDRVTHFELLDEHVCACRGATRFLTRWATLADVEKAFPQDGMIRIQRHLLLRPSQVKGMRPASVGRIKVLIAPGLELVVSRAMTPRTKGLIRADVAQ